MRYFEVKLLDIFPVAGIVKRGSQLEKVVLDLDEELVHHGGYHFYVFVYYFEVDGPTNCNAYAIWFE